MRSTSLLLMLTLLAALACNKSRNVNKMILESSFEGSDPFTGWENTQHCCDYSVKQSQAHATDGSNALMLDVRSTDGIVSSSIRSELVQPSDPVGTERWYGFNMYLENWVDDNAGEHVFQWHPDNSTGSATASLWTSGGRYVYVTNDGNPASGNIYTDLGPILSNQWISWVIHVKWSSDETGILQVWKNGQMVINRNKIITCPPEGTYFKLGINKFGWGSEPSTTDERILYFDEVRIGNEHAGYEDVKPRH